MRNLKRALSLTLASVMLLGMMVVGSSALSFNDADDISNVTAATVLEELKVMQGDGQGNFMPEQTVTRAQMAILICRILYGDKLNVKQFEGVTQYNDVAANDYYTGYINLATSLGIINGYGDGRFGPDDTVTTAQAALMLSRALGYFQANELEGQNWALVSIAQATKIDMFGGLKLATNEGLARDNVAEMVFNTMTKAVPVHYSERWDVYYTDSQSILNGVHFNYRNTLAYQNFDLVYNEDKTDDFERPATEWGIGTIKNGDAGIDDKGNIAQNGANIKTSFIKAVNDADAEYTAAVKLGDIYKDLGLGEAVDADKVDFYRNGKDESVATKITDNSDTAVDLDTLGLAKGLENKIGGNGVLTQVWYDTDDKTAVVSMIDTYVGTVNTVFKASGSSNRYVTLTSTTSFPALNTLNNKFETEAFESEDLVTYTAAWNGSKYDIKTMELLDLANTAVLTRWEGSAVIDTDKGTSNSNFTAGGTTYKYSKNWLVVDEDEVSTTISAFDVNESEINIYLDKYGYAIYVSGVEGEKNYAAVIGIGASNTHGSETKGVTLLLPDGTQKAVTAKMDDWSVMTTVDQTTYTTISDPTADDGTKNLVTDGVADVVTYSIGSDGVYKLTLVGEKTLDPDGTPKTVYSGKYDIAPTHTDTTFVNGKSEMKIKSNYGGSATGGTVTAGQKTYYTTSKTIFMVATQKKEADPYDGRNYNVYIGYANAPGFIDDQDKINGIAFATNKQYTSQIDVVYIDAVKMAGVSGADTFFVKDKSDIITTSDGKYYDLPAVIDGKLERILIDAETKADWNGTGTEIKLEVADKGVYAIENIIINSKNIIESCDLVAFNLTEVGTVKDRYDVLGVGTSISEAEYWSCVPDVKVFYVDKDWALAPSSLSAIQTDDNDLVYAMFDDDTKPESKKLTHVFVKEVEPGESSSSGGNTSKPGGADKIPVEVTAVLKQDDSTVKFLTQGDRSATVIEKSAAVLAAYVKANPGYNASDLKVVPAANGVTPANTDYKVMYGELVLATYTETAVTGEIKVPAVVPPASIWEDVDNDPEMEETKAPNGQSYKESYQQLVNSPAFSKNLKTEIVAGTDGDAGKFILKITGIKWMSVDTYVPCFGADQNPKKTVKEAYCTTGGNTPTLGDLLGNATQFAIVSLTDKDGGTHVLIIGNDTNKAPGTDSSTFDWLDTNVKIDWGTIPANS